MRVAGAADRDLLIAWYVAFHDEALGTRFAEGGTRPPRHRPLAGRPADEATCGRTARRCRGAGSADRRRTDPDRTGLHAARVTGNRGYASSLVAAVSQAQLDAVRWFCFLFTDLANPTSNHIYQEIGYEPVRDVNIVRFD